MKKILYHPGWQKSLLCIIVFFFYSNTLQNDYALDDLVAITQNNFVKKGVSGIPEILTHDTYYGATGKVAKAGGRYRPLSLVAFAIEIEFFGLNTVVFHFFNILFYALLCLLIHQFLIRHVFKENYPMAFVVTLLFAIHPVHTEVVANIKSGDEIFSLFFLIASLHFLLNYLRSIKRAQLILSLTSFFLALLSKENGLIFFIMIPLTLFFFSKFKPGKIIRISTLYWLVLIGYVIIRFSVNKLPGFEENDVMNSPYLLASLSQKFATIFWVLGKYLGLLFFPSVLSYDYSYNQISYVTFSNLQAVISVLIYGGLFVYGIVAGIRKISNGYWILFFLASLFLISNILVNISTAMADRFLFGPSLFFLIAIGDSIQAWIRRSKKLPAQILIPVLLIIIVASFLRVYYRNQDWKNNLALFLKDSQVSPNSARAHGFCGMALVTASDTCKDSVQKIQLLKEANSHFLRAYSIHPEFKLMFQDWGGTFYRLNNIDSATWVWNRQKKLNPQSKFISLNDELLDRYYYNRHIGEYYAAQKKNDLQVMLTSLNEALKHYNKVPSDWILIGKLYQLNNKTDSAKFAWEKSLELQPGNAEAIGLLKEFTK